MALARFDDDNTSTTFQLAKCFNAQGNETLIVEHPFTWFELLRGIAKSKSWSRLRSTLTWSAFLTEREGLTVIVPPALLPINFLPNGVLYKLLSKLNQFVLAFAINRILKKLGWDSYHYINSYNYHFPTLHRFLTGHQRSNTYHCVDPIIKSYTRKHGISNELLAVKSSDMVISTAPSLREKWTSVNESHLVPNAVDYNHFNRLLEEEQVIRSTGKNLIGYFGNIERRIDYELLYATFQSHPEWDLILAGPVEEKYVPAKLKELKNVHFTGSYSYDDLPNLINSVDATIIPFKCDDASRSIYPLKLYEYFSVGKPTISTLFNPDILNDLSKEIYLVGEDQKLETAIQKSLREENAKLIQRRRTIASQNTWEQRAAMFLDFIFQKEQNKTAA